MRQKYHKNMWQRCRKNCDTMQLSCQHSFPTGKVCDNCTAEKVCANSTAEKVCANCTFALCEFHTPEISLVRKAHLWQCYHTVQNWTHLWQCYHLENFPFIIPWEAAGPALRRRMIIAIGLGLGLGGLRPMNGLPRIVHRA